MDKRLVYIVLGSLVILYLVGRKTHPELLEQLREKAVATWHGKPAPSTEAADQWEKHRADIFAARVAESKQRAVAKYPKLAEAGSEMNIRFVFRYQWMVKENNARLRNPDWPELVADDCAEASRPGTKAVAASKPEKPAVRAATPAAAAVAIR